jgi:hypothetical protein
MSERVVGASDERGRAVARKRPTTAAQRIALAWEAEALAAAAHPGVVELLGADDDGLTTVYAGTHSLATSAPLTPDRIAAVGAAVATTVADLHLLGIVHGRIDPSHVIVGPDGRPVLCGFSGATVGDRVAPPMSTAVADGFADPRQQRGEHVVPVADVYAIGALIRFLLDRGGGRPRPHAGRHRSIPAIVRRRSLAAIARRAMALEPHRRPTARALADQLGSGRTTTARPVVVLAAGTAAVVLAVGLVVALAARGGPGRRQQVSVWPPGTTPTTTQAPPMPTAVPDGPAPVVVGPNVVAVGVDRYQAGSPSDQMVLGDWNCDGQVTVALLRVPTGEVFIFDAWPTAGHDRTIPPTTVVAGAVRAQAGDPDGDGCPDLVVERDGGRAVEVDE